MYDFYPLALKLKCCVHRQFYRIYEGLFVHPAYNQMRKLKSCPSGNQTAIINR